ncbi:MAG: DUF5916 domain-containing protein [Bacteroides sp.]|nr:DUF5916 domain-containing protein [Bacteroides sp.]
MTLSKFRVLVLAFLFLVPWNLIRGQNLDSLLENKRVYATHSIGELALPKIDGELDDEIWDLGEWQGTFTQQQPVGGVAGSENTYVKVLYDRSNLFVAIICQDSEPDLIRDIFDRRDALGGDMTGIALDSYMDRRTAFEFNLSAAGQKMDLKHLGDYQWDFNWNAVWDGATSMCDSGWIAEMKIPFSQIRYADTDEHVWGMHVWRWIARKAEEDQWQYIPLQAPAMVYLFGELKGVEQIRGSRQVELLPYVSAGLEYNGEIEGKPTFRPNAGIDAKVGISSDYTLDLSINPDYGQVEADPSVLNLTAFETFYQEKRPFFMEGNDIFDFELDGDIPYYSRRIGSAPNFPGRVDSWNISEVPRQTTLLGAAKLTGKSSKGLSLGVVNGLTAGEYARATNALGEEKEIQVLPMSNYFSSRVKKEFDEGNTILGGVFSLVNRFTSDSILTKMLPSSAVSGGLDLLHYWKNKNYYFQAKSIGSQLRGSQAAMLKTQLSPIQLFQRPDADYLSVDTTREQLGGHGGLVQIGKKGGSFNFDLLGQYRSPGLNLNDMGFIRQADFVGQGVDLTYRMNEPGKWIRNYEIVLSQKAQWSFGGENTLNSAGAFFTLKSNKLWTYMATYNYEFTHINTRDLRGGPGLRIDGEHLLGVYLSTNRAKDLSANAGFHYNTFANAYAHQEILHASLTWLPVRKVKLSGSAVMNTRKYHQQYVASLYGTDENLYVVGHIDQNTFSFTLRAELFLSPELSLQYYGSPYYSVGKYEHFGRVDRAGSKDISQRIADLDVTYNQASNSYSFDHNGESWSFNNPDFSFMEFRSNLVFRWEYKLGSTLYFVWAHDRSGWESVYNPITDITGELIGIKGNNVFMFKLNFWFSV